MLFDNEQAVLALMCLASAKEEIVPGVTRYDSLSSNSLYSIDIPKHIKNPDELLALLGGRKWFHQYNLEARPIFTYIVLDLLKAPIAPSVSLSIGAEKRVYLGVHLLSRFNEDYDWDKIASELGKALEGNPS